MIICCHCNRELRCLRNGVYVELSPGEWRAADKYGCACGTMVITDLAVRPVHNLPPGAEVYRLEVQS